MTKTRINADSANDDSIAGSRLENGAVTADKLSDSAVSTNKLSNGAVTNNKVSSDVSTRIRSDRINFIQLLRTFDGPPVDRTVESKCREIVSVEDFGAVGNGTVDDTEAIQAALNNFNGATGLTRMLVFSPNKNYRVTAPLIVPSLNQRLIIDGRGAAITCDHNGDGLRSVPFNSNFGGHHYYNLTIVGPNMAGRFDPSQRPSTGAALYLEKFYQGVVENCRFSGFNFGIRLVGGNGNVFAGNNQVWNNNYGIWFETTNGLSCNANTIENMYIRENWKAGIWFNDIGELSEIKGNRIDNCIIESNVPYPFSTRVGSPTDSTGIYLGASFYTYITNCYFEADDAEIYAPAYNRPPFVVDNCNFTPGGSLFPSQIKFKCTGSEFRGVILSRIGTTHGAGSNTIVFEDPENFAGEITIVDSEGIRCNTIPAGLKQARCRQNSGFNGIRQPDNFNDVPFFASVTNLGTNSATLNVPGYNLIYPFGGVPITGQKTIITNIVSEGVSNTGREITFFTSWGSNNPPPMYIGFPSSFMRGLPASAPYFWMLGSGDFVKFVGVTAGGGGGFWHLLGHGVQGTNETTHSNYRGQVVGRFISRYALDESSQTGVTYTSTVSSDEIVVNDPSNILNSANSNVFSVVTDQNGIVSKRQITSISGGGPAKNVQFTPALAADETISSTGGFLLTVWIPLY